MKLQRIEPLIYIVDKNPRYRDLIVDCLSSLGISSYKVFDNGENCFTANLPKADLIIVDYNLGEGNWNGLEFMEEYDRVNRGANFLFMSSTLKVEIAVESIRKGAQDYILKSRVGLNRLIKQLESIKIIRNITLN